MSNIGYGYLATKFLNKEVSKLNIGYQGLIGFFFLVLISIITSFLFPHNSLHNSIIHIIGLSSFIYFSKLITIKEKKLFFILLILLLLGSYIYKNHDDFGYYHLTYSLNLTQNNFIIGTGHFSHGFRTNSSIFFYNSLLYLPYIKFYLFHISAFYILLFVNYIFLNSIFESLKKKNFNFIFFYCLLSLTFINVVFYRIGEHGTDRSAQILVFLVFLNLFELILLRKSKFNYSKFYSLLIIIILASSLKALYYIYLILIPYAFYKFNDKFDILKKIDKKIILVVFSSFFLNISINFLNTGCLLYPAQFTCFETSWSIPKDEVKLMKTHYEWWAKAGGGPGYDSGIEKDEYIKNFVWFKNWVDRHFFNKVSDTLFGTIFICVLFYILYRLSSIKRKYPREKVSIIYLILFIFLIEWLLKHPAMRYGGYVLVGLPLIIFSSNELKTFSYKLNKSKVITIFLIFLIILTYVSRNLVRINKEIIVYNYNILNSPFFYVEDVKPIIFLKSEKLSLYTTNKRMCWATKTPCSYRTDLFVKKLFGLHVINRAKPD